MHEPGAATKSSAQRGPRSLKPGDLVWADRRGLKEARARLAPGGQHLEGGHQGLDVGPGSAVVG